MRQLTKHLLWVALLAVLLSAAASPVVAVGNGDAGTVAKTMDMTIAYGITSAIALLLACGYAYFVRQKNSWLLLLFISVVVVNLGYFSLSISKNLSEALLANRVSYLGSVFLPLCMLMVIIAVCRVQYKKWLPVLLVCFSVFVFLLAASPGYLTWYYSDVSLIFINGMAKLEKVYGPLHCVYLFYLLGYFGLMIGVILTSIVKKTVITHKHAALLLTIVFLNIAIWAIEQLVYTEFEILSVSYIASEILLLILYGLFQDCGILQEQGTLPVSPEHEPDVAVETTETEAVALVADTPAATADTLPPSPSVCDSELALSAEQILHLSERWAVDYTLTGREAEVLVALLQDKKRKDIAAEMNVTEHTVKKHTGNIFSKLNVTNRAELFAKAVIEA